MTMQLDVVTWGEALALLVALLVYGLERWLQRRNQPHTRPSSDTGTSA